MPIAEQRCLTRPSDVRALTSEFGFHPSRSLGQNFLVDGNILKILTETAAITEGDRVLEVGPGLGVVTEALLARGAFVVAVEKDRRLFRMLQVRLGLCENLELVEGDGLDLGVQLVRTRALTKMVSNLPYNPGSRILMELVCADPAPQRLVITVQLEVAERVVAEPGTKDFGILSLWCQLHCHASRVKVVSPNCFWPRPAVLSAIVKLERRCEPLLPPPLLPFFYKLTRHAFQHRRKQLVSILAKAPGDLHLAPDAGRDLLEHVGVSPGARPEDLPVECWCMLVTAISVVNGSRPE